MTKFVAILVLLACPVVPQIFGNDYEVETERAVIGKEMFHGVALYLGTMKHESRPRVVFYFDLGIHWALVGNANKIGFGIDCLREFSCQVEDKPVEEFWYMKQALLVQPALTHLTTDPHIDFDPFGSGILQTKMPLKLIEGRGEWLLEDWGAIGLGPNSVFASYLKKVHSGPISFVPYFKRVNDDLDFRLIINPTVPPETQLVTVTLPADSRHWAMEGKLYFSDQAPPALDSTFCFTTSSHEVVLVQSRSEQCFRIHKIICNGRFGSHCTRSLAVIHKAPTLRVTVKGKEFDFPPEEYLQYEGEMIKCKFGDMSEILSSEGCSPKATLGLGNGFFEKFPTVFGSGAGKSHTITILSAYLAPIRTSRYFRYILLWGVTMAVTGGLVVWMMIRKTKPRLPSDILVSVPKPASFPDLADLPPEPRVPFSPQH